MIDMGASPGNIQISQQLSGAHGRPDLRDRVRGRRAVPSTAKLEVIWNNVVIGTIDPAGPMTSYSYVVTATGIAANDQITFREVGHGHAPIPGQADEGYHGTYLANVAIVADRDRGRGRADRPLSFGNHDFQIGDAVVTNTDGDNNEATATGNLNIKWGADNSTRRPIPSRDVRTAGAGFARRRRQPQRHLHRYQCSFAGGASLTSQGVAVTFVAQRGQTVLTGAPRAAATVFQVSLSDDGTGNFRFVLLDQLDHAPNGNENDIALTFNYTATDSDGDAVSSKFIVSVDDDMPVLTGATVNAGEVFEDGLSTGNHEGVPGSQPTSISITPANLTALVHIGADGPGTFGFNSG